MALRKNLVKSRNVTKMQQPTHSSESVKKFVTAQIGCIDVAAVGMAKRPNCVSMPNFVAICRNMEIFIFQDGGRRHLGFLKFQIFNGPTAQEVRTAHCAKFC